MRFNPRSSYHVMGFDSYWDFKLDCPQAGPPAVGYMLDIYLSRVCVGEGWRAEKGGQVKST